jgi:1-acyl-sn-glycerol-3-phosphate acyltransferase
MGLLRAAARLLAIAVVTGVLFPLYLLTRRRGIVRGWYRALARILGLRTTVTGNPPRGVFLLVTNHVSWLDVFLLGSVIDVTFVAMAEIRHWPFMGTLSSSVGTIFVKRDSRADALRVADAIEEALAAGKAVALFPEGAASDGRDVMAFKSALLEPAARAGLPVHYAAIVYASPAAPWFGETGFVEHFQQVIRVPRLDATLQFGGSASGPDRKELAKRLHTGVRDALRAYGRM